MHFKNFMHACLICLICRGDHFRFQFGSVRFFKGKNRFKPVWLGFSGFGSVFSVLARFFRFCLVFSVWLGFGSVFPVWLGFGSVWLGFFSGFLSVSVQFGSVFWVFCL